MLTLLIVVCRPAECYNKLGFSEIGLICCNIGGYYSNAMLGRRSGASRVLRPMRLSLEGGAREIMVGSRKGSKGGGEAGYKEKRRRFGRGLCDDLSVIGKFFGGPLHISKGYFSGN